MKIRNIIMVVILTTFAYFMGMDTTHEFLSYLLGLAIGTVIIKYAGKDNKVQ